MSEPTHTFLSPWEAIAVQKEGFQQELQKEVSEAHPLFDKKVEAIATRADCDDVLFQLEEGKYAVVHLTWKGKTEENPIWPATRICDDWEMVWEEVIKKDHASVTSVPSI